MAYVDRFIFRFNSVSGKAVRIAIADNDYTGAAVERRLGGSPQLRCELSGNIHGMSLEIPAECKVDDEFAVLYTSDPTRFAVRLEVDNVVVWRGFVTPELYAAPWVDPPYDVQITATDGLGELKMMEWPAIGSRTLKEILDTVLGATGLALGIRMISAAANDIAAAEDLLTGTTVNLDHMAGKSYYDVLDGLLGSLHCTISQRNGVWLLVRETDVTSLTSGGQVSDTSGNTYPVKSFGSSQTHDCWPVGRLTTEIVPAKSVVEVECPNHLASLIADPDMELNLWQTNGSWTGEDGGYYTLDLNEYISQVITVANASRDADPGFRIKVSSRHTTPFGVGIMRLTVMATGRDPRSGSDKTLYLKEVTTQGRTQMEWATEESHFDDGLGLPKTLDHQDCKEFETDIFRLPTSFNPLKSITVKVTAGKSTVCVHSVHIECMSVYDKAVTRLVMDNGARGDESNSPLFADSFVGNKGNFLLTNSLRGVAGAIVRTWSSDAIPSVPYGEWLSKDMALSVATPRLRMSGRLFTVTSLPALFYSNKGLSYITEEWSLDLLEDEADISLISLPAAALSTVSVSVIVEDNDGRKGTVSGGEIVSPKTGDSSSGSGYLDWFIAESYEEDGETEYRLKLNPKYEGMYAEGWVSAGGVSEQGGGGGGTGYLRDLLDVNASMSPTQGQALVWDDALGKWTAGDVSIDLTPFERIANRVTTVSSSSNHTQYPTAKAVYDIVNTMLSSAMRFQGVTSTALVDGSTTNPVIVDGASYTATRGDVVVRSDVGLEYLWTGARWQQLGDETSYAKKTVTITGSGYLTGGGNLEAARTIDIAAEVKTKIDNGATAFSYFTDGAANEAIKLKTPRSIWGQNFDGSANVSGAMTGVTRIYMTENLMLGSGETGIYLNKDGISIHNASSAWTADALKFDTSGNARFYHSVGIGVAPSYPLDVNGDSRISGKVYIGTSGGFLEVVNVGTTASPVYALKSSLPFFSDSWVSAGGVSSTGSGGGITGYLKDLLDVNGSMIPVDGQALVWDSSLGDNGRWTSKNVSVDLTPFERTTNRVTSISASSTDGQYPSARAVYNAMGNYLPLTGGTMTGDILQKMTADTSNYRAAFQWVNTSGVRIAEIGYMNTAQSVFINPQGSADAWSDAAGKYSLKIRPDNNGLTFNTNKVWHAGNDGSGSGLDADLLDGWQGERYVLYDDSTLGNNVDFNTISYKRTSSVIIQPVHVLNYSGQANYPVQGYGQMLTFGGHNTYFPFRIAHSSTTCSLYYQSAGYKYSETFDFSEGSAWREIAFVDSNVASATKLQTARKLWGNDFDGNDDVKGSLEIFSTGGNYNEGIRIHPASNNWCGVVFASSDNTGSSGTTPNTWGIHNNEGRLILSKGGTSATPCLTNIGGNWGIDTYTPAYKFDINGIIRAEKLIGTATGITETSLEDEEFTYQATPINDIADGYRIDKIKGKTLAWNQQVINGDFSNGTANWYANQGTATVASNELTYICSAGTGARVQFTSAPGVGQSGHVYYMRFDYKSTINFNFQWLFGPGQNLPSASSWSKFTKIGQANSSSAYYSTAYFYNYSSLSAGAWTLNLRNVNVFDLTLIFGAGNEPSTADEFESMFPETYYDYTAGELVNNSAEAIETVGFNQWDEVWEPGAIYADGSQGSVGGWIRSKNFCPCIPGADYYYINAARLLFYDSSENFVQLAGAGIVTAPANAAYFKISTNTVSYNHNICVNLSDPGRNSEYEPYWSAKTALGLSSIKAKDSNGNIHEINGLALAGKIYDDITGAKLNQRVGRINLGSLNWAYYGDSFVALNTFGATHTNTNIVCPLYRPSAYSSTMTDKSVHIDSNGQIYIKDSSYTDAAAFKAAMSGVMLYYELATPVTYDLVSPVPLSGRIDGNGTMRVISEGPVAPFRGDITYGCNPGQMGADASSVKSYLDTILEIKVVDGQPVLHSKLPLYSDSWISAGGLSDTGEEGGATYLKNLLDVDDNLVESAGYGLVYDGTQWTSEQIVPASRKINGVTLTSDVSLSLGSLSNVSVTGATNGQQLIYNGSEWIAGTPAGAKFFHGTCSTSSSSNTKVVDCPSFTSTDLVAGTAIAIVMYNRCDTTSTVTINVNGTGANTLLAGFANRKAWSAGELILAVYDGSGEWDMLPTWYYTYYYGGGGSGGGGGTGSTVVVTPRLSSGTRIATITVDGSATDLYAPSVSVSQTQGSTGGTQIASINSTAIYAPAVTVTQVQTSGVEVARIKVGSANPVSIYAPSGSSGASGVQTVVGKTGDVTTDQIATALTNAGYKLTDTVQDLSGYLPLTAGSSKALTNTLYTRGLLPTANASYDLGSLSAAYNNTYTKRVYLADGVYIEYDSTNRCVYIHGAGIATDSYVSAGGVSTTSN